MSNHTLDQAMLVDSIVPSKDNARHIDQKSQSFRELVESIKAGGVQIPIHVWPHPKKKDKYEIRCGERRWRACKNLAHKTIPAIVHRGINIQTAMLLTITENKFREKLLPLEEVCEVSRCMDHLNNDAKLIAGLIGQTEQWVRLRANIHKSLGQGWRSAFEDFNRHPFFKKWSVGHLTLIARLPASGQQELLENIKKFYWQWENVSVKDLDQRISSTLQLLVKANWNLDDVTLLPKAGACSDCKKRSGAHPVLWFGALENQIDTKDRCLDPLCWNNKMHRYLQQRAKQLGEKYSNLAYRSTEHLSANDKEELSKQFGRVLDPEDVQKSTKGAKGAIPAMVVNGKGAGTITFVKEKKFASPGGARRAAAGKPTPLKQRRETLSAKRWSQVLIELRKKVDSAGLDDVVYKDKITGIMALAALFGNVAYWMSETPSRGRVLNTTDKAIQKQIDDMVKGAKGCDIAAGREHALGFLWTSVKPTLKNLLSYSGPASQTSGYCIISARWVAKLIQVDIDKLFQEVSKQKGFTVPKSWAGLNEDGTPKKKKAARKSKATKKPKIVKAKPGKTVKVDFRPKPKK